MTPIQALLFSLLVSLIVMRCGLVLLRKVDHTERDDLASFLELATVITAIVLGSQIGAC